ncbi:MAG: hypothetical protein WC022_03195 [Parcubacteria group bacterium]
MTEEEKTFNCKEGNEGGCPGTVVVSSENRCSFGGRGCGGISSPLYPCDTCGKLHEADETPAENRGGDPFFLTEKGFAARRKDGTMFHF